MIPYGRQQIEQDDIDAVVASLRSEWLTQGPAVERLEFELARRCQVSSVVACNSGTAALHLAYAGLGLGVGDTVVVPANTFLATANAAVYLGANVRFCDVDPTTGLMTPATLAQVLDERVSAVVPVHFAGQPCDMTGIVELVREHCPRARIVEDASHAIGAVHADGSPVGCCRFADAVTFSFHPVKHIAAGEGGAVATDHSDLGEAMRRFRCHGMTKRSEFLQRPDEGPWYYEMHMPGFNYRIPDFSCALAASQLGKLERFVARRRQIAKAYLSSMDRLPIITLPPEQQLSTSSWHLFCLHIDFDSGPLDRAEVMAALRTAGVGTQVHYFPVPLQPYYQKRYGGRQRDFPGAWQHYQQALSIPIYPAMTDADIAMVMKQLADVLSQESQPQRIPRAA